MRTLYVTLLALFLIPALAVAAAEGELKSRWDTVRFALGVSTTDNFDDRPVIILHRADTGGFVSYRNGDKFVSRPLTASQLDQIVVRLTKFFAGAELLLPNHQIRTTDHFEMLISIDQGFTRMSYHKDISFGDPSETVKNFTRFIRELITQ